MKKGKTSIELSKVAKELNVDLTNIRNLANTSCCSLTVVPDEYKLQSS